MKITVVLGPFYAMPPDGCGAVEKVWYDLCAAFADQGHTVTLIGKASQPQASALRGGRLRVVGLAGYSATGNIWLDLLKDFCYGLQIRRQLGRPDVLISNSFWLPVILLLNRRRPRKLIVHVARFPKRQMWLYRHADVVQPISTAVAEEIVRQTPVLKDRLVVLPYPIDLGRFRPPEVPRDYRGALTVLYVGRVHPEKGLDVLIKAFRMLIDAGRPARLRIVGPDAIELGGGGAAYIERLQTLAGNLPVEFVGAIRDPELLAREYRNAHCFCYPSLAEHGEALGLAALEAMATGLPAVVSDLACFKDFIDADANGLVFDHRSTAPEAGLASALDRMLRSPVEAQMLGEQALERSRQFELDIVARQYLEMLAATVHGATIDPAALARSPL